MEYAFRWGWEIFWAVVIAAVLTLAQLVSAEGAADAVLADPQTWLINAAGAVARAAVAAAGVALRKLFTGATALLALL